MLSSETKQRIRLALWFLLAIATARAGYIFYQRHQDRIAGDKQQQARNVGYSNPDYYVSPKKLYPYDLKSARQLTQQPEWVKEGYRYTYYVYDPTSKRVQFGHDAGLLGPIEKLVITDVITATPPGAAQKKQVLAIFHKNDKSYAVP